MQTNNQWDPLANVSNDQGLVTAARKREIKNILKSYTGTYDCFSELIQNSMDAIDKRYEIESKSSNDSYKGHIWITVNIQKHSFHITDNGIGFNESEFRSFLAPNTSFKDGKRTRGSKGVGSTYIAYGFNYLQLGTKSPDFSFVGDLKNGRDWIEDVQGIVIHPLVKESIVIDEKFNDIDRGSTFSIIFGGEKTRPKNLTYFNADTPLQWLYILLIKTPLGCIDFSGNKPHKIKFTLSVINKYGDEKILDDKEALYIYPHTEIKQSLNLKSVLEFQKTRLDKNRAEPDLPPKFFNNTGLYEFFDSAEIKLLNEKFSRNENSSLIDEFIINAYGYFCYSTSVWDKLNDDRAKLRKGMRILKGGLQLSNNFMPQGELLTIPLTSSVGYQNQCHIIVHFHNADPDLGRKGFQPELKELAEDIAVAIVNRFKKSRKLLKNDTGSQPIIHREIELHAWLKETEQHEENNPLKISNSIFFLPVQEISITSIPQSEQDVIVLFNQLLAGGVIRGIKLLATNQKTQYDGIFKYQQKKPLTLHEFDRDKNPLGVQEIFASDNGFVSPPKILEYKFNVDALIREFENEEKNEKDIHLIIAWELGEAWKKNYDVTSLLDIDNIQHRQFHGITHILASSTNPRLDAIILKELIDYLNDIDGVQEFHQKTYGEDIF
jgi:hypothetical protein